MLPIVVGQPVHSVLTFHYREQAPSHLCLCAFQIRLTLQRVLPALQICQTPSAITLRLTEDLMTIRAVVFDFGGVLFDWNPHHLYRKLIADDHERQWFLDTICTQAWNTEQDAGRSLADATRSLIDEYPHHHALIQAYYDRWHEMLLGPLPEGVAILTALHQANMPLFGLTNWSAETFPYARAHYPFLQIFRDIVVSGEVKLIKPDAAIYHASLDQVRAHLPDIQAREVVFIDDVAGNIEAAVALGWQGIHHVSAERTAAQLRALGVGF